MTTSLGTAGESPNAAVTRRLLEQLGGRRVSQRRLAFAMGVQPAALSRRITGATKWDVDEVDAAGRALCVNPDWLLTGNGEVTKHFHGPDDGCPHQGSNLGPADYQAVELASYVRHIDDDLAAAA